MKKKQFNEAYFNLYRDDKKRETMYQEERSRIENLNSKGGRILDVGCGIGGFLSGFDKKKWDLYGVDIAKVAIKEARSKGIKINDFPKAYEYPKEYFDVIVFRGSLQLIPTPFSIIEICIKLLKPGGYIIFLSTPNSNSPYYRRFKTLPFLTPHLNFLIPSDVMMKNTLINFGLKVINIYYPYYGGPYANFVKDHFFYILSFLGIKKRFAFWKSSMEIYAQKPFES